MVRKSAVISIALHLAILLWAVVAFPTGRALDAPMIEDVPIDIVSPSEFTKIKAGMVDAKDEAPLAPKPEVPKPKAVTKEPPKPPKAEAPRRRLRERRKSWAKPERSEAEGSRAEERPKKPGSQGQ
jgi:hypothetical protein